MKLLYFLAITTTFAWNEEYVEIKNYRNTTLHMGRTIPEEVIKSIHP
jgi:hypothetical protein